MAKDDDLFALGGICHTEHVLPKVDGQRQQLQLLLGLRTHTKNKAQVTRRIRFGTVRTGTGTTGTILYGTGFKIQIFITMAQREPSHNTHKF